MFVVFISFQFFLLSKYNNLNNAAMFFFACSNAVSILKSDIRLSFIFFFLFLFCFFFVRVEVGVLFHYNYNLNLIKFLYDAAFSGRLIQ